MCCVILRVCGQKFAVSREHKNGAVCADVNGTGFICPDRRRRIVFRAMCFFLSLLPLFRYLLLSPISQHSVWSEITSHNSLPLRLNSLLNFPYLNCPALQFRSRIFEFCICQSVVLVCRFPGLRSLLSRRSRHRERLYATGLFVCLSVSLSPKYKNAIFSKTKQFRAMVSIDDL